MIDYIANPTIIKKNNDLSYHFATGLFPYLKENIDIFNQEKCEKGCTCIKCMLHTLKNESYSIT